MEIFVGLGVLAIVLGIAAGIKLASSRRTKQSAPDEPNDRKCINCQLWDQDAGQRMLRSSPTFVQVMQHVTPNQEMGTKVYATRDVVDAAGATTQQRYVKEVLPVYPPFENRWEYLGGCKADGVLTHRIDTCPKFMPKDRA